MGLRGLCGPAWRRRIEALAAGDWIDCGSNLIAIGNSGPGKTHVLCAIGHVLIEAGFRVLYTRTTDLVQKLQSARRDLVLEAEPPVNQPGPSSTSATS